MKKSISIILCAILLILSLAGCSSTAEMTEENVNKTVDKAFCALADFDTDELDKYVDSATLSVIMGYAEKHEQFAELGRAIFANLSYEVTAVDLDNKTVTVSVKNKDLYQVASDFASQLKNDYTTIQLLGKLSDEKFLDKSLSALCDDITNAPMTDNATDITLSIEQSDKNLVLVFDANAESGVSGSALDAIKSIYSVG